MVICNKVNTQILNITGLLIKDGGLNTRTYLLSENPLERHK